MSYFKVEYRWFTTIFGVLAMITFVCAALAACSGDWDRASFWMLNVIAFIMWENQGRED